MNNILKSIFIAGLLVSGMSCSRARMEIQWPVQTNETKPWTRWWWHGSTVDSANLTANLEALQKAGFGGVEITPIYDVKGYEEQAIPFQSEKWMQMFEFTLKEAQRLGLGVDLANASGWPFGGNWIGADEACKNVQHKKYELKSGQQLKEKVEFIQQPYVRAVGKRVDISEVKYPISSNTNLQELALDQVQFEKPLPLQALMAFSNSGESIELTSKVDENGMLDWIAPEGDWKLYAVFEGWHGKMVERAGTRGEGNVIDHFSEKALNVFLADFDEQAKTTDLTGLRAFFNDSYEVDDARGDANWTPLFFEEFKRLRGYDLKEHLPALFGDDDEQTCQRVLCDYRETISDLLLERFTMGWAKWAEGHGKIIRNQAHGSPANILDLYEASHIPETEGTDPMRIKMATSAGHTSGKPLIACEAATWLNEHFLSTLSAVKQNADRYLANGVNHIVYHGTPYSPVQEQWPGWMFYASVHFAPTNTWWDDLSTVNHYIANCQSFMQNSKPLNDVLLYFPIYDAWTERERHVLPHFGGHTEELTAEISNFLLANGYTFDYISDRQIKKLTVDGASLKTAGGADYKTIIVPKCESIPLETIQKLFDLAKDGIVVLFEDQIPGRVVGWKDSGKKEEELAQLGASLDLQNVGDFMSSKIGKGRILVGSSIGNMLADAGVDAEVLAETGLWFNRVKRNEGACYFLSNWTGKNVTQWIPLQETGKTAIWFDPMTDSFGKAQTRKLEGSTEAFLDLKPGQTLILQWYSADVDLPDYPFYEPAEDSRNLEGNWEIAFSKGGPTIPEAFQTDQLSSWTEHSDELKNFSGTALYRTTFNLPENTNADYLLDLGEVHESAVVILNGQDVGTLIGPEFQIVLPGSLLQTNNTLDVWVTNLMANRIIHMDKTGEVYRKFYNINFAANKRENLGPDGCFTAINWEPLPSGLLGPVTLTELKPLKAD